jgi:hypothetical protein
MSHAATLHTSQPASRTAASFFVPALLIVWLGLVLKLGATGAFVTAGEPPVRLLAAVLGPVTAFLIAYRVSSAVREFALTADLRFITAAQGWRAGGFTFLALNAYGILPAYFAWPAGVGDMAIGVTAVWMLAGLARKPGFGASRAFALWNVLGILDLVVAVTAGAAVPLLFSNAAGVGSTDAMAYLPLVLIPAFFVPGFLILHAIALVQAREAR